MPEDQIDLDAAVPAAPLHPVAHDDPVADLDLLLHGGREIVERLEPLVHAPRSKTESAWRPPWKRRSRSSTTPERFIPLDQPARLAELIETFVAERVALTA